MSIGREESMMKTIVTFAAAVFAAMLVATGVAFAIPSWPHQFYGSVTWNGVAAPDGTVVKAQIDGADAASVTTSGGSYNLIVDDPNSVRSGKTVVFFVNGVQAASGTYCNGCSTQINLAASGSSGGPTGGGGGGGGGGGITGAVTGGTTNKTNQTAQGAQGCQERWVCSDWGECTDSLQRRTCRDVNNCGTNNNEPFSVQPCSVPTTETQTPAAPATEAPAQSAAPANLITGFLAANPAATGAIVVVVLAAFYLLWRMFRKKSGPKPRKGS